MYFCSLKKQMKMEPTTYANDTETVRMPRTKRTRKASAAKSAEIPKTPESELMTVEEFFGILRKRVNEYYESLQS